MTNQSPQLPISLTHDEFENISIIAWPKDTVVTITGDTKSRGKRLSGSEELPDSVNFCLPASIANQYLLAQDWLLLRMIIENRWQRPIYFTDVPDWLRKHCRLEGLVSRLMPVDSATIDCPLLHRNLMESYVYTGYADHVGQHDWITQTVRQKYISSFLTLIECEKAYEDSANTALVSDRLKSVFPRRPDGPAR